MQYRQVLSLLFIAALSGATSLPAAQDNLDANADLEPTPCELAYKAVLERWPDATEIDVLDALADDPDADDDAGVAIDPVAGKEVEEDAQLPVWNEDAWTISVAFICNDHSFEVLTDDSGRINYVYEELDTGAIPPEIAAAARGAVKDAEIDYCDQRTDESGFPFFTSYIVGIGGKEVYVESGGKVVDVQDVPDDDDDDAPDFDVV